MPSKSRIGPRDHLFLGIPLLSSRPQAVLEGVYPQDRPVVIGCLSKIRDNTIASQAYIFLRQALAPSELSLFQWFQHIGKEIAKHLET